VNQVFNIVEMSFEPRKVAPPNAKEKNAVQCRITRSVAAIDSVKAVMIP